MLQLVLHYPNTIIFYLIIDVILCTHVMPSCFALAFPKNFSAQSDPVLFSAQSDPVLSSKQEVLDES